TDGDVQVAVEAMLSARHPHWFPSLTREGAPAVMGTTGNDRTHLVLRGGTRGPNYSTADLQAAVSRLRTHSLPPHLMVDCSHANSGKDPSRQPFVASALAEQIAAGEQAIAAVMLESNLVSGTQPYDRKPLVYGKSITDSCLAWEETLPVLDTLAAAVRSRRERR
ncbi:MAG: 3-deoxy-7-phosphoheptulonate synthase, partial [Opitutaceae bacterium]